MIAIVLSLCSAICFGVSDFFGGLASRRLNFITVTLISQVCAFVLISASLPFTSAFAPETSAMLWGGFSGIGSVFGGLALYRGLAGGNMAVAAPLSAVGSAIIPTVVGVAGGDRLAPLAIAGVIVAFPAIWLVSKPSGGTAGPSVRSGTVDGLIAGAGFGLLYVGLGKAGDSSGLWPVFAGELIAVIALIVVYLIVRPEPARIRTGRASLLALAVATGVLSVAASILFFFATHAGMLTVSAVLSSIYPGFTVLLAAALLRERPGPLQLLGLGLCAVAVVSIALA